MISVCQHVWWQCVSIGSVCQVAACVKLSVCQVAGLQVSSGSVSSVSVSNVSVSSVNVCVNWQCVLSGLKLVFCSCVTVLCCTSCVISSYAAVVLTALVRV